MNDKLIAERVGLCYDVAVEGKEHMGGGRMFPRIDLSATGRRIQALREGRGLSVRELQTLLGFEQPQAIYKWQRGECLPTVDHLLMLSRIFGLPMQDILVIDDQDIVILAGNLCIRFADGKEARCA